MISNVTVQARVSAELKQEAEAVFSAIGMSTAEAIRVESDEQQLARTGNHAALFG